MNRFFLRAGALALSLGLVACGATSNEPGASQNNESETSVVLQDPVGLWGSQEAQQPWLEFAEDGKLTGSDGCNRLVGSWKADGEKLDFGQLAGTRMFCEGVDDWLSGASSGELVEGEKMAIFNQDGKELGTLAFSGKDS